MKNTLQKKKEIEPLSKGRMYVEILEPTEIRECNGSHVEFGCLDELVEQNTFRFGASGKQR